MENVNTLKFRARNERDRERKKGDSTGIQTGQNNTIKSSLFYTKEVPHARIQPFLILFCFWQNFLGKTC